MNYARSLWWKTVLPVVAGMLLCPALRADQVKLKNGDRLTGSIVKSDTKSLVIKTEYEGEVTVEWSAVESISSTQPLNVGLPSGQMVAGPVTTQNGELAVETKQAGTVTVAKDSVQFLRSDAEQAAYVAAQQRLLHPTLSELWHGTLDTGLSLTRGNSALLTYTLAANAIRQTQNDKISVYMTTVYGRNDTTSPSQTIAHQITGGVRGDINVSPKWFAFAATDFNSNELQHLDLQNTIYGGAGYHVWQGKTTTFDVFGGAGYNQEYFGAYELTSPGPPPTTQSFAAITQRDAEMNAGESFDTRLNGRTTLTESFNLYPGISGPGGYRFTFNSTAATKIKAWLGWQVTFTDNYISNPPFGIKGNDLLLSTGLRVSFGKGAL